MKITKKEVMSSSHTVPTNNPDPSRHSNCASMSLHGYQPEEEKKKTKWSQQKHLWFFLKWSLFKHLRMMADRPILELEQGWWNGLTTRSINRSSLTKNCLSRPGRRGIHPSCTSFCLRELPGTKKPKNWVQWEGGCRNYHTATWTLDFTTINILFC